MEGTEMKDVAAENIVLEESSNQRKDEGFETIHLEEGRKKKVPRRVIHFSDGVIEEYSTDEEEEEEKEDKPLIDPSTLTWGPYLWYYTVAASFGALGACEYLGEKLAWFFGITSPKYQYAIDEYYRNLREEKEEAEQAKRDWEEEQGNIIAKLSQVEGGDAVVDDEIDITA
uniref:Protein FAM177A1-like n=1 Tax=Saccoglossus kowalevskii TaxID=10224 RepID=A0ABM0GRC0_SACKO|nr:PREDICTED: protein FAM177A1-like [Saccoglossus kowalevskii]